MSELQTTGQMMRPMTHHSSSSGGYKPPQGGGSGLTGKDIWRIIRKRKWLVIIPTVLLTILSVVVTMVWLSYAPFYTAAALLSVDPPSGGPMERTRILPTEIIERMVMSHVQMVNSESVLKRALDSDVVKGTSWYKSDPNSALERLMDMLKVSAQPGTNLIRVAATATQKEDVANIASEVARAYEQNSGKSAREDHDADIKMLQTEGEEIERSLSRLSQEIQGGIVGIGGGANMADAEAKRVLLTGRLQSLQGQLDMQSALLGKAKDDLAVLESQAEAGTIQDSPKVQEVLGVDPQLRNLRQSEVSLTISLESALDKFAPGHRTIRSIQTSLDAVRRMIQEREKVAVNAAILVVMEEHKRNVESTTTTYVRLQKEYDGIFAQLQDATKALQHRDRLKDQVKSLEDRKERIEDRLVDLRTAGKAQKGVRLVLPAEIPLEPSMPKWSIMIPSGLFLGLLIGLGMAFLLEFMDTSIKNAGDISRRFDLPILGMVPHLDDVDEDVEDIRELLMTSPDSLISESFRRIRTCLMFSAPAEHRKVVLVTSAQPEDGRTSVTMNLAASIAHGGRKVLVVDTNFWQPEASRLFVGTSPETKGLCNVLVGQNEWREVIHEVEANMHVMATGPMPPNPAELLGSDRMRQFLADAVSEYDQILLDGAPCLVVSDAVVLSTVVDGVILVIRAGVNTHGVVQRASSVLSGVGAKILGAVLNGVRVTAGGYLQETYDTFYDYQERAKLPSPE